MGPKILSMVTDGLAIVGSIFLLFIGTVAFFVLAKFLVVGMVNVANKVNPGVICTMGGPAGGNQDFNVPEKGRGKK